MPEAKVTCRYCPSEEVSDLRVGGLAVPICDRHNQELHRKLVRELDRVMGEPVNNGKVDRRDDGGRPVGEPAGKPDGTF